MKPIDDATAMAISKTRNLTRRLGREIVAKGVEPADVAVGIVYALHDISTELHGDPAAAIEWVRNAADIMEQGIMDGSFEAPTSPY